MFIRGVRRWVQQHPLSHSKLLPNRAVRAFLYGCPRGFHSSGVRFFHPGALIRSTGPLQARGPVRVDHEPPLDDEQLKELFSGYFPTDYPKDTIRLKTSFPEFLRLQEALDTSKNKLTRKRVHVMYNKSFHATTVRYRASALHDCIAGRTLRVIDRRLSQEGKFDQFRFQWDQETIHESEDGKISRFAADLSLEYINESTGHSQKVLVQEFERMPSLQVAILVKIDETPNYKNPLLKKSVFDDPKLNLPRQLKLTENDVHLRDPANPYGPLEILGYRWVGELAAFMEIWIRDPQTGKPTMRGERVHFYGRGHSDKPLPLTLSDFSPPEETFKDTSLTFDWVGFRKEIDQIKPVFAMNRCYSGVEAYYRKKSRSKP